MSRDVITVGSTMRIPLLYKGEHSQWRERFMNYLEEQTDGEVMINSIQNGDQPLPIIAQVSLAENAQNAPPTLKDLKFWTAEEKKTRKIDHRKAEILYEYETFKATEGEQLIDTYLRYLQVINDLKNCGYKKDSSFNRKKYYAKPTNNNLRTSSASSANKKPEYVKSVEKKEDKKADEKKRDMSKVKCYNCKKEGHFAKDCKKTKVKDYNYYKTKMLLAKKDSDEQEINANMVFMAQIEKIMKSSTMNVETSNVEIPSNEEEVFHESSESFQEESSSSSLNDDVQQSSEEVGVPSSNTQSISNNMIPNVDEASTSHNVFNERLEDAYFDASTSFHDPSNVYTFYQPYPYEKKWTKDHLLHKIIGDLKSSVRTRGQLANACLFSCLLSSIEPANVAEALRDADRVSAMQEELDQFA
nr:hypothetical protein [Tanacetum cinerariifolium]